ncbi:carbon-nitrogen hydrolase family protein [Roseiflexus sp.]|uniref:carbon-nitrogen hydrolase family protein n=1 Tax=Roseiflexus sp. TaxID=2562120 RepID=UPI0021DD6A8B|nr:carbon-nitrogen hydrolase family protein [Roseiflexus sp.]GIV99795.1 MAG: hypothetical protein KatS3mg058_1199 [Roseiflexus sp.]
MRLCAAQIRPVMGDIARNAARHFEIVDLAVACHADLVFFPDLSLTGYAPPLATSLASSAADPCLNALQQRSDAHNIVIGAGLPIAADSGVQIGMVWFVPDAPRRVYAKQQLHVDEMSCFVPGSEQIILEVAGWRLAPALCYESLQMNHADGAARLGAEVYLASVAKPAGNLAKAMLHYPAVARRHAMDVIMANCTGPCDDFVSVGQSAVWNSRGERLAHMGSDSEGVVMLDVDSGTASIHEIAGGSRTRE